jgi:hypothetical protein
MHLGCKLRFENNDLIELIHVIMEKEVSWWRELTNQRSAIVNVYMASANGWAPVMAAKC